jgi:hypothetical protein
MKTPVAQQQALADTPAIDLPRFATRTAAALGRGWTVDPAPRPGGCGVAITGPAGQSLLLLDDSRGPDHPRVAAVGLYPADLHTPAPMARLAVSARHDQGPAALAAAVRLELPRYAAQLERCYSHDADRMQEHAARVSTARRLRDALPGAQLMGSTTHTVNIGWAFGTGPGSGNVAVTGHGDTVRLTLSGATLPAPVAAAVLALLAAARSN